MKRIIVVLIIVLTLSVALDAKKKDSKKKKGSKEASEFVLLLDDGQLIDPETELIYARSLAAEAEDVINIVATAIDGLGNSSFTPLYTHFMEAKNDVVFANEMILQALGYRKEVVKAKAEETATKSGNAGQKSMECSESAEKEIEKMASKGEKLTELQKEWFKGGLTKIGTAVLRESALIVAVKGYIDYVNSLKGLSKATEAKNLGAAADMAKELPGMLDAQVKILDNMIKIAKTNNIKVPDKVKLP